MIQFIRNDQVFLPTPLTPFPHRSEPRLKHHASFDILESRIALPTPYGFHRSNNRSNRPAPARTSAPLNRRLPQRLMRGQSQILFEARLMTSRHR